ncbi:MAG TPA: membrane dipeptidase [Thermomicrobiales bacterium]|jgi:membrane dipeptidase|nr:membrane dipeptidase [Thermomicrobiales bacterium]
MPPILVVDGHTDPAYNTLVDGRDYLRSAYVIRAEEAGGPVEAGNGICMLGVPEWLAGRVAVVVTTLTAIPRSDAKPGELGYPNAEGAHQAAVAQLHIYRDWAARHPQVTIIEDRRGLDAVLASWEPTAPSEGRQVGLVLLIENADVIREPAELDWWLGRGVRMIGPAWSSNRYTGDTDGGGPLTPLGRDLVARMARRGVPLDVSHMSDRAIVEACDLHDGVILASHANPRRHVDLRRNLSDDTIRRIAAQDGIVGIMPLGWALDATWSTHRDRSRIPVDRVVDAIEAVCEMTGGARHVGIGSDFDGGQGAECAPDGIDTTADLGRIADRLAARGYADEQVVAIMSGNWLRVLSASFPG